MTEPVRIVEVGPRDGLQNEAQGLDVATRQVLIARLAATGLQHIEAGAMVAPARVPHMANSDQVLAGLDKQAGIRYPVLIPNLRGLETAIAAGVTDIAIFASASETFSQRNIHCSIQESLARFAQVAERAQPLGIRIRGYVSCVAGCPYEGPIQPAVVAGLSRQLIDLGCEEISLGDTIGIGTPGTIMPMLDAVSRKVPVGQLAGHFHDTRGMALVNIHAALQAGLRTFDASVGGLGGCPYATGASGNVATEEVVYLLEGLGYQTGIKLAPLVETAWWICRQLGKIPQSRLAISMPPE